MAIIKKYDNGSETSFFTGRVLEVTTHTETRNWSDTLDYSDWRSTACTFALVWLGPVGVPGRDVLQVRGRTTRDVEPSSWDEARDLEFFEQFVWVDCTNLFSDRYGYALSAVVDAAFVDAAKEPLMWTNYIAWKAWREALEEKKASDAAAAAKAASEAAEKAAKKRAAAKEKAEEKDRVSEAAALKLLEAVPPKGTTVTVGAFTGKVTWTGTKKYRGMWNARVGVKNAYGEMIWVDASDVANKS
jgi:hypothetical protein